MNLVILQDKKKSMHRNLLDSYTLILKDQKEKLRMQFNLPSHQKRIKYLGINLPKEESTYTQKTAIYWWQKSKKTQIDWDIYHVLGLEE